jgi:hypothetical protein
MARKKAEGAQFQPTGVCTWCGHHRHGPRCIEPIKVAAGPSGGAGRAVPTKTVPCPCRWWEGTA